MKLNHVSQKVVSIIPQGVIQNHKILLSTYFSFIISNKFINEAIKK